jgi:serine/threonine-protein kinase
VRVEPFFIDRVEVSSEQMAAWLKRRVDLHIRDQRVYSDISETELLVDLRGPSASLELDPKGRLKPHDNGERWPAMQVARRAAEQYCSFRGARLPTEAEWELAARGPERRKYPWGDGAPRCDEVAFGRKKGRPCEGLSTPANVGASGMDRTPEGVMDLGGNAAEWVVNAFEGPYADCAAPCPDEPRLPVKNGMATIRGGTWEGYAVAMRGAARSSIPSNEVRRSVGLRCAAAIRREIEK